jgi:RimJ/RimL family protein N-acetyltransferase
MEDPSFAHLTSDRLIIRRFVAADADALASYRSDPEVARYQDWECPYPIDEAAGFIASLQNLAPGTPGTWFQFAVSLQSSGDLIGDVGLHTRQGAGRDGELGFTFAVAHQGHGYATEAVRAVVEYAFGQLAMDGIFARTDTHNVRARRLLESLGFEEQPELREHARFKGAWATDLVYARHESALRP